MKNLKIKVFLLGIFTIALGFWGVRVGAAEDLYRCTCVGTENGPKTPIGVFAMNSETECKARAAEGKAFLAGKTDPNNPLAELSNNYDCYWGKAELGRCECVITTSGGVVVDSESSAKDRIFIDNELGCKSFEESANKVFKAPGGSGSTANCTYKTISDGCYCNIERPNDLNSPMLVASAVIEKTEETCKDGGVGGDPSAPDYTSYTMCRYKKTEGTFGAGTLGGNPVGAVAGGGSVIAGPSFVNNAQNVGVYKGVGFINDGTSVKLANPLGAQDIKISTIIGRVIKTALGVMGSFAFLAFVYGGFLWLIAGGNDERVKKGKDSMVWATIGIFVIFSAYGLMSLFFSTIGAWQGSADLGESSGATTGVTQTEAGCYCRRLKGGTRDKTVLSKVDCVPNKTIKYQDNHNLFTEIEDCVWQEAGSTTNAPPAIGPSGVVSGATEGAAVGGGTTLPEKCKKLTKEDPECCKPGTDCCAGLGEGYACQSVSGQTCSEQYSNLCLSNKDTNYKCVKTSSCKKKTAAPASCKPKAGVTLDSFCSGGYVTNCTSSNCDNTGGTCSGKKGKTMNDVCGEVKQKDSCSTAYSGKLCEWK